MKLSILVFCACVSIPSLTFAQQLKPQRGNASYYSDRFHGHKMSNGERYHRDSMTCAHLSYPLGTWLRVRNLTNGKEVVVRVTDRGPYSRKFSIDLSRAAARKLDIIHYGWRPVEILPFVPGKVPYLYEPSREKPVLNLGFSTDEDNLSPYWQEDSTYQSRHRLSRTMVAIHPDTLRAVVHEDTTIITKVKSEREKSKLKN